MRLIYCIFKVVSFRENFTVGRVILGGGITACLHQIHYISFAFRLSGSWLIHNLNGKVRRVYRYNLTVVK